MSNESGDRMNFSEKLRAKKKGILDAELKRAFAVTGFSGTFCVVAATCASLYISPKAALLIIFTAFAVVGSFFILTCAAKRKISKIFLFSFIGICVCMTSWTVRYIDYGKTRNSLCNGEKQSVRLVLTDDGYKTARGFFVYPAVTEDSPHSGEITVITRDPIDGAAFGVIEGEFLFSAPEGRYVATNFSSDTVASVFVNTEKVSFSEAEGFFFSKKAYAARKFVEEKIEAVSNGNDGFLKALILGQKKAMPTRQRVALSEAGLSHIIAVSGLHVSVLIAFLSKIFSFVKNRFVRNLSFIFAVFALAALCGFTSSVVRACLMSALAFSGNLVRKKSDSLNSLGFAAFVLVTVDPFSATSASFLLSFAATLGILLFAERLSEAVLTGFFRFSRRYPNRLFRFLSGIFCTSLAAFFFTFPLLYYFFGEQSLVSLLSNVVCLPIISVLYPCAIAAVFLEMTGFAHPIALLLGSAVDGMTKALMFLVYRLVRLRRIVGDMRISEYCIAVFSYFAVRGCFLLYKHRKIGRALPRAPQALAHTVPPLIFLIAITLFSVF